MAKKRSCRPHGHYCKICGEYKANEKFSGKSHATHICKACSRLSASAGFYEWDRQKRKYLFNLPGEGALYMAGLYSIRDGVPRYVILTTDANESIQAVHHRMPLVLQKGQVDPWLTEPEATMDILHSTPPMLKRVSVDAQLQLW